MLWLFLAVFFSGAGSNPIRNGNKTGFDLTIIHINDWHSRYEPISETSGKCKENQVCVGGFSRMYRELHSHRNDRNVIFLNAGDNYQGTLWFSIFGWNITQHFLNKLPCDAYTLGNHEFDKTVSGVVPFIKSLNAPHVVANIDDSRHPELQGLYNKSTIVNKSGKKIGIIGVIAENTALLSQTENLLFLDPIEAINKEVEHLEDCDVVMVLSHCGIEVDLKIAQHVGPKVSVIVGGHSHTVLYNGPVPGNLAAQGPYPVVVERDGGRKVLVVQAGAYSKFVGNLTVSYGENGKLVSWSGQPIYLGNDKPTDEAIDQELKPWREAVDVFGKRVLGSTEVFLNYSDCAKMECNIGDLFADAMVDYYKPKAEPGSWTYASIAFTNSGSIRTSLQMGNITYDDLATTSPFDNTIDVGELTGGQIKETLEHSFSPRRRRPEVTFWQILQVSGVRFMANLTAPEGSRISNLKILCRECQTPKFEDYDPIGVYRVALPSFVIAGGDGYGIITDNIKNVKKGILTVQILEEYIKKNSPIAQKIDGRINIVK